MGDASRVARRVIRRWSAPRRGEAAAVDHTQALFQGAGTLADRSQLLGQNPEVAAARVTPGKRFLAASTDIIVIAEALHRVAGKNDLLSAIETTKTAAARIKTEKGMT